MGKSLITLLLALLASHAVFAARIKRKSRLSTHGSLVQQSDADRAATVSALNSSEAHDEEEKAVDASAKLVSDPASDGATIAEYAVWTFEKASAAFGVYQQFNIVKLAVNETILAADQAQQAVDVLVDKISQTTVMFVSSGLSEIEAQVNRGFVDLGMVDGLFDKHAEGGETEFMQAMDSFRSCTNELNKIARTCDSVMKVLEGVKGLSTGVHELTAFVNLHEYLDFDALKSHIQFGKEVIEGLVNTVVKQYEEIAEVARKRANGMFEQGRNLLDSHLKAAFDITSESEAFRTVFDLVVKPLVIELVKGVRAMSDMAQDWMMPDAPESVATDKVSRWSCSWRNWRIFDSLDDVDIEQTMSCRMEWFGRYRCSCIGSNDCYVTRAYRPNGGNKRCFAELDRAHPGR